MRAKRRGNHAHGRYRLAGAALRVDLSRREGSVGDLLRCKARMRHVIRVLRPSIVLAVHAVPVVAVLRTGIDVEAAPCRRRQCGRDLRFIAPHLHTITAISTPADITAIRLLQLQTRSGGSMRRRRWIHHVVLSIPDRSGRHDWR